MRGEKPEPFQATGGQVGSPPRARGEERACGKHRALHGITPACAGRSCKYSSPLLVDGDHPRVRGEKRLCTNVVVYRPGSPPRARGEVVTMIHQYNIHGITPACAGRRCAFPLHPGRAWDHPRVRGEKLLSSDFEAFYAGSPPRARGEDGFMALGMACGRITPACAGRRL